MDLALVGLLFGIAFGALLQRGRFCMAAAARDLFLTKDTYLAKGVLYAILFTSIGFFLAQSQGLLELQIKPLGLQNIIGGLLFGVGMVIAVCIRGAFQGRRGVCHGIYCNIGCALWNGSVCRILRVFDSRFRGINNNRKINGIWGAWIESMDSNCINECSRNCYKKCVKKTQLTSC